MKLFSAFLIFFFSLIASAQVESSVALTANPDIVKKKKTVLNTKTIGTFDSTFIYISDTLQLPFLDEFSTNKFQQYNPDFSDPTITFDKKYRLLNNITLAPLPTGVFYTDQPSFRRTYDVVTSTFSDVTFVADTVKVGDLSSYPVVYQTMQLYPP